MLYSTEVEKMTCVAKGPNHGPAPIPQEGRGVQAKEIKDIAGLTHGVGWCAPQQGAPRLVYAITSENHAYISMLAHQAHFPFPTIQATTLQPH